MFKSIKVALASLASVFALGTCAGCASGLYVPGSKTAEAVQEECTNRPVDQTVYCLTGVYDGLQFALAEERANGSLSPSAEARIETSIQFLAPRVITIKESWRIVAKWQAELDALQPLAAHCIELATKREDAGEGMLTACLTEIGFLAVSGKLSDAASEASADWGVLEPQLRAFITLGKKEIAQ